MKFENGKLVLNGISGFENPLDNLPLKKRLSQYNEWRESERITFRSIWLDRYVQDENGFGYEAHELKISNRGRCFLDDKEIKKSEDISTVNEIFNQIKVE